MLDGFDFALLIAAQRDDSRTADSLAEDIPLSPSAIARRLRRLRREGWIARTVALLSPQLTQNRLRAFISVQLSEHADRPGIAALERRLVDCAQIQFCYEIAGSDDLLVGLDCANMAEFNELCGELLVSDATVRRYETTFIKREVKFAPFIKVSDD